MRWVRDSVIESNIEMDIEFYEVFEKTELINRMNGLFIFFICHAKAMTFSQIIQMFLYIGIGFTLESGLCYYNFVILCFQRSTLWR